MFTGQPEQEMEFMPIVPLGEDEMNEQEKSSLPLELPIIALKNTVLFPNVVLPITVAREKSVKAIAEAQKVGKWIGVIAQKDSTNEDPMPEDIYEIGTLAKVVKQIKMPDGNITIFIMGRLRFRIQAYTQIDPYYTAQVEYLEDVYPQKDAPFDALIASIKEHSEKIAQQSPNSPYEASIVLRNIEQQSFLMHFVASNISAKLQDKQAMLEENDIRTTRGKAVGILQSELQLLELKNEITNKTSADIDRQQREYFLQQQMKSIREELGGEPNDREIKDLQKRAEEMKWTDVCKRTVQKEYREAGAYASQHTRLFGDL
jgi:ATP-dependent Lon protease